MTPLSLTVLTPHYHIADYPVLLELLGPDEFERTVRPLHVARERLAGYREGRAEGYAILDRRADA